MNSLLIKSAFRNRSSNIMMKNAAIATRGGGFHKPDPLPYGWYKYTRRTHLEDINTILYSDIAPEFHMHLHSIQIQSGKQGWTLIALFFLGIIFPCWCVARKCHKDAGAMMFPCVRPGPDHAHMAPRLVNHLKSNNYENSQDFFGRKNATFYRNYFRQEMSNDLKPKLILNLNKHGFSF